MSHAVSQAIAFRGFWGNIHVTAGVQGDISTRVIPGTVSLSNPAGKHGADTGRNPSIRADKMILRVAGFSKQRAGAKCLLTAPGEACKRAIHCLLF